jgi:hypothetical protein
MHITRHDVALTTIANGSVTAYTPVVSGRVLAVGYVKTDFVDGVDITVTTEDTARTIVALENANASVLVHPRVAVQDAAGADATLDGTRLMREPAHVCNERVKIVVAQGGNVKTGSVYVLVG